MLPQSRLGVTKPLYMAFVPTCFTFLRALCAYVPTCFRALNYYVPTCSHFSKACVSTCLRGYIYFSCQRALNYFAHKCAHFSRAYVPTTTQDFGTDIYPDDVKSDEN